MDVVDDIYADDPHYVRALDVDVKQRLSPKHPYFEHGRRAVFIARQGGRCVGRIVAHTNDLHVARYNDGVGFFGFFDTIDDKEVAAALFEEAIKWLRAQGLSRLRGPITMNMAEEVGCLIEGFDYPPMLLMGHHRPYQAGLIEQAGFEKIKDTYAWKYVVGPQPARVERARADILAMPEIRTRRVEMKTFKRDVEQMLSIYNEAWQDNWGYVPMTKAEADRTAAEFKLVADLELSRIIDVDGRPVAFAYALPNLNEAFKNMRGKLNPLEVAKAIWHIKFRGPDTARLVGLGISKEIRGQKKYAGLSAYLYSELNRAGKQRGFSWGELSFTLEDNGPMNVAIRALGATIYKRYRIFERAI